MRKYISLIVICHIFSTSYAQSIFQHSYGNSRNERCQSAFQATGGGFLLNGVTTSFGNGDVDALIIKTDAQGNILWSKTCGTTANEITTFATETFDNNIIFIGTSDTSTPGTLTDVLLFKTDSSGNFLWAKTFGGANNETAVKIIEMPDHGYAITGTTESYGAGSGDVYLLRTDVNGDSIFSKIYGTPDGEVSKSMSKTSDGGFIICGKRSAIMSGSLVYTSLLMRIDSLGNLIWANLYGGSSFQEAQSVEQTSDGGFIVCGSRDNTNSGNYDILLFKTDGNGNLQWSKRYGGNKGEASYMLNLNEDDTYVLSGYTNSMGYGHRGDDSTNIFLMKTDANGDTIWTRTYGDSLQEEAFLSCKTSDGGFLISGFSNYHDADSSQMLIIKTDDFGQSGCYYFTSHPAIMIDSFATQYALLCTLTSGMDMGTVVLNSTNNTVADSNYCLLTGIKEYLPANSISLFPNPVTNRLYIKGLWIDETENKVFRKPQIAVYNVFGEKLIVPGTKDQSGNSLELNVSALEQGMYLLEILSKDEKIIKKFLKE